MTEDLQKKINRAIKLLQAFDNPQEPVEVAYSGGKDSDVILQLVRESGINYRAIHKCTTIDPPGTIKHVIEQGVEIRRPKKNFRQLIEQKGLPSRLHRFCCEKLKEYKILDKCVMGVRQSESRARKERYPEPTQCRYYGTQNEKNHVEAIYPIHNWTDDDVLQYINDRNIKLHPLYYKEDGSVDINKRLGCMCCPLMSKRKRIQAFKDNPRMVRFYLTALEKFYLLHPESASAKNHKDHYEQFVHDVFFPGSREWGGITDSMFGVPDCKKFLENYFNIKL